MKVTGLETLRDWRQHVREQGIELIQGYDASQLDPQPDLVIIGNAMTRGNPCVEAVLENIPADASHSGRTIFGDRWVLAVAGTHGKTTTAGMATWILDSVVTNRALATAVYREL